MKNITINDDYKLLLFIRHGEYFCNPNVFINDFEVGLSKLGKSQIKKATNIIYKFDPDVIFSSDFLRTIESADIISKGLGKQVVYDKRLRERAFPFLYGKTKDEISNILTADEFQQFLKKNSDFINMECTETLEECYNRLSEIVDEIIRGTNDKRIVFVSHGGPHAWLCELLLYGKSFNNRSFEIDFGMMSMFKIATNGASNSIVTINASSIPSHYLRKDK